MDLMRKNVWKNRANSANQENTFVKTLAAKNVEKSK